jgi:hypothetical protein
MGRVGYYIRYCRKANGSQRVWFARCGHNSVPRFLSPPLLPNPCASSTNVWPSQPISVSLTLCYVCLPRHQRKKMKNLQGIFLAPVRRHHNVNRRWRTFCADCFPKSFGSRRRRTRDVDLPRCNNSFIHTINSVCRLVFVSSLNFHKNSHTRLRYCSVTGSHSCWLHGH